MAVDIDTSITELWRAWQAFRTGKKSSEAIMIFESKLVSNLIDLTSDIRQGIYRHGNYDSFIVHDPKRREIAVACVRDRVVHRLIYDYLVKIFDNTFSSNVWSCRAGKGLHKGIEHAEQQMRKYKNGYLWRSDITKFFDTVDQQKLESILGRKLSGSEIKWLLHEILKSYEIKQPARGIPIGNLTSQIFANIYMNEFDQFIMHNIKPRSYTRYGDDFVLWFDNELEAKTAQTIGTQFLRDELGLATNPKHDRVRKTNQKLAYLGVDIWPTGRRLQKKVQNRIKTKLKYDNASSYKSLVVSHQPRRYAKRFNHDLRNLLDKDYNL